MHVYASVPSGRGGGPFPAVIVSQHGGGVDQFIRDMTDKLPRLDSLPSRPIFPPIHRGAAGQPHRTCPAPQGPEITADITAAVDWLRAHPAIQGDHIGITGFCMGGRVAWLGAATNRHIQGMCPLLRRKPLRALGGGDHTPFELASGIQCPCYSTSARSTKIRHWQTGTGWTQS